MIKIVLLVAFLAYLDAVNAGAISTADVTPASLVAGASGAATATFTTANPVPADGKFVVTFPANFDVTGATVTAITGQTGAAGSGHTINCAAQVCTVTRGTTGTPGIFTAGVTTVVFGVVKNPAVSGATGTFTITTTDNSDVTIDTLTTVPAVTITAGVISVADVTPASLVAGATGAATATFTTANPVPADGKFVVTFPANFDVTGATVTAITGQTGNAGVGHMINCAGQVCIVTRGTAGSPGIFTAGVTTVVFGVVKNPAVSGATGTFTITTTTNGDAVIDTLATVPAVTITPLAATAATTPAAAYTTAAPTLVTHTTTAATTTSAAIVQCTQKGNSPYASLSFSPSDARPTSVEVSLSTANDIAFKCGVFAYGANTPTADELFVNGTGAGGAGIRAAPDGPVVALMAGRTHARSAQITFDGVPPGLQYVVHCATNDCPRAIGHLTVRTLTGGPRVVLYEISSMSTIDMILDRAVVAPYISNGLGQWHLLINHGLVTINSATINGNVVTVTFSSTSNLCHAYVAIKYTANSVHGQFLIDEHGLPANNDLEFRHYVACRNAAVVNAVIDSKTTIKWTYSEVVEASSTTSTSLSHWYANYPHNSHPTAVAISGRTITFTFTQPMTCSGSGIQMNYNPGSQPLRTASTGRLIYYEYHQAQCKDNDRPYLLSSTVSTINTIELNFSAPIVADIASPQLRNRFEIRQNDHVIGNPTAITVDGNLVTLTISFSREGDCSAGWGVYYNTNIPGIAGTYLAPAAFGPRVDNFDTTKVPMRCMLTPTILKTAIVASPNTIELIFDGNITHYGTFNTQLQARFSAGSAYVSPSFQPTIIGNKVTLTFFGIPFSHCGQGFKVRYSSSDSYYSYSKFLRGSGTSSAPTFSEVDVHCLIDVKSVFMVSPNTIEIEYAGDVVAPNVALGLDQWSVSKRSPQNKSLGSPTTVAINGNLITLTLNETTSCESSVHIQYTPSTDSNVRLELTDSNSFGGTVVDSMPGRHAPCKGIPEMQEARMVSRHVIEVKFNSPVVAPNISNGLNQWNIDQHPVAAVAIHGDTVVLTVSAVEMICEDPYTYYVAYTPNTVAGEFLKSPDFGQRTKSFHNLVTCDFPTPEKKSAFVASEKTIELRYDMPMTAPDVSNGLTQWSIAGWFGQVNPTAVAINGSIVVLTISSAAMTCGPSYSIYYYPNGNANQRLSSATSGKRAHPFSTNVDCPPAPYPLRAMITSAHTVDLPFNFEIAASDVSKLHEAIYYESTLYQSKRVYARKASISGAVLTLTFGVLPKTACYNSGISQIQFNSNSNPLVLVGAGTFAQKRTSFQVHDIKCAKRCDGSAAPLYGSVGDCDSVVSGMTCQPTCASGFTVSGTSSCSFVGEFTSATCSPQGCDVPSTINEAGIFSWNNALCTPSATVPNGTTCTINENEGYICSSPGLCVRGSFSSVAAAACSLRIPEVQSRKIISATSVEIVFDLALSGTIDPAQFTLTPNGATPTAAILNGKVLMLTVDTMTTADCGNRQITYTKASADLFDRRLKTPQGGEVAGFNNKPLSCDTCDGSTIPVHGAIGSCSSAVTAGASCQPTCNTGYTVSGPAFCDLGTQFVPAVCNPNDCAMPVITEGVFKWSDPKCGSGSLNVPSGTTCLITADTDYTCISPGKCTAEVFERNGTCFRTCPAGSYFAGSGAKPTDKNFYKDSVCTACP
eukprot:Stramenopile-MAST_4_protein_2043